MMNTAKHSATSFQALVAANRSAGRLSEPVAPDNSKKMQLAGMRLLPAELEQAKELAAATDRSVAWVCRSMFLRGLEAYKAERGGNTAAAQ